MNQKPSNTSQPGAKTPLARALWPLYLLGAMALLGLAVFAMSQPGRHDSGNPPNATSEAIGKPHLNADRQQIDLGDVKLGRTVEATFVLTNTGDQPARFTEAPYIEVKEGC